MKPITNILLALALVCYLFLPFYEYKLQGGLNGFEFTAGLITRLASFKGVVFALLPFITGFLAMAFNCLKNKYWSILSVILIAGSLLFFATASDFHEFALSHPADVIPGDDLHEGFAIEGLGIGFVSSCTLMVLSLISAILSLLPFKFNEAIERVVDDTIDKGLEEGRKHIKHISDEMRDEWNKIESKTKRPKRPAETTDAQDSEHARFMPGNADTSEPTPPPLPEDKEDDSRFMPKQ